MCSMKLAAKIASNRRSRKSACLRPGAQFMSVVFVNMPPRSIAKAHREVRPNRRRPFPYTCNAPVAGPDVQHRRAPAVS
jgi:hypothetical protein